MFCSQRGSDEMVTSPGVEGGPVSNGDTIGTNHVDNNNDAKKVKTYTCYIKYIYIIVISRLDLLSDLEYIKIL